MLLTSSGSKIKDLPIQNNHIVQKSVLAWQFASQQEAQEQMAQLGSFFQEELVPVLDRVLGELSPTNRHLQIDKLEIDLGAVNLKEVDQLKHRWEQLLRERLEDLLAQPRESRSATSQRWASFLFFLQYGFLPWNSPIRQLRALEAELMQLADKNQKSASLLPSDYISLPNRSSTSEDLSDLDKIPPRWLQIIRKDRQARSRLVEQFSPAFLVWLLQQLGSAAPSEDQQNQLIELNRSKVTSWLDRWVATGATFEHEGSEETTAKPTNAAAKGTTDSEADKEIEEGLWIANAGVVLLHPFLEHFFRVLEVDMQGELADRNRAVYLLHYLATGEEKLEEPQAVLYKALCNLPLRFPLAGEVKLEPSEKDEAQQLLLAAINHWDKLGNTSPQGLRENFLQREGILRRPEKSWHLRVEHRSFDILLESLPWSLSVFQFPWMSSPFYVDWT